jgi:hypothetical protein
VRPMGLASIPSSLCKAERFGSRRPAVSKGPRQPSSSGAGTEGIIMNSDKERNRELKKDKSRNPDPITGAPGSHPIGTGIGAAAGGAAAGAAVGTVAGPVGTAVGAAIGAVVGGLAGKGIAEKIDPTREDAYWRDEHVRQPYASNRPYDEFAPAYRVGYEGYGEYGATGKSFEDSEAELRRRYELQGANLPWKDARPATIAAWRKFEDKPRTDVDSYGNPRP